MLTELLILGVIEELFEISESFLLFLIFHLSTSLLIIPDSIFMLRALFIELYQREVNKYKEN